jgi:tripartite-type tricarboxylate transporter receptor subunit TctC
MIGAACGGIRHTKAHTAKALIAPELQKIYDARGYDVAPSNPEAANAFLAREYNKFHAIIENAHIEVQ